VVLCLIAVSTRIFGYAARRYVGQPPQNRHGGRRYRAAESKRHRLRFVTVAASVCTDPWRSCDSLGVRPSWKIFTIMSADMYRPN